MSWMGRSARWCLGAWSVAALVSPTALGCSNGLGVTGTEESEMDSETGGVVDESPGVSGGGGPPLPPIPEPPDTDGGECNSGALDCPCTSGGNCEVGLVCESGWCIPAMGLCGDGLIGDDEECDDANDDDDDGCSQDCACQLSFGSDDHISGWELEGDWTLYGEAPLSDWPAVPFSDQGHVFGSDGNRVSPYPGSEIEVSSATTTSFMLPDALRFRSWHVDEGAPYDNKRISVSTDGGETWSIVVDCASGPNESLPFCPVDGGPRGEDDWDDIEIDIEAYSGVPGQVRFEYETLDECCGLEQGWFIDDINTLNCP